MKYLLPLLFFFSMCSCSVFEKEKPDKVISLHALISNQIESRVVQKITDANGVERTVKSHPLLHNMNVQAAESFRMHGGYYGLRLKLDDHGRNLWLTASSVYAGQKMCLFVDGDFKGLVHFDPHSQSQIIKLYCTFTKKEADKIAKEVKKNYRVINDK